MTELYKDPNHHSYVLHITVFTREREREVRYIQYHVKKESFTYII